MSVSAPRVKYIANIGISVRSSVSVLAPRVHIANIGISAFRHAHAMYAQYSTNQPTTYFGVLGANEGPAQPKHTVNPEANTVFGVHDRVSMSDLRLTVTFGTCEPYHTCWLGHLSDGSQF